MSPSDELDRLANAAERIAGALEQLVQASERARPLARLVVARSPTDENHAGPVSLKADGTLLALIQNVGEADTTLREPRVHIGEVIVTGGIIEHAGTVQQSADVPAAKHGPGVTLHFKLEGRAQDLFREDPAVLFLPHSPGRFPGTSVTKVDLEPLGPDRGTAHWRAASSTDMPEAHAAP